MEVNIAPSPAYSPPFVESVCTAESKNSEGEEHGVLAGSSEVGSKGEGSDAGGDEVAGSDTEAPGSGSALKSRKHRCRLLIMSLLGGCPRSI